MASRWSTGLFGCFSDFSNCCTTLWCPCVTFGRVREITDKGLSSCCGSATCYVLLCIPGLAFLYSCFNRGQMRHQYFLKGNTCTDCLVHYFCGLCALCQEFRELQNQGFDMYIGWEKNVATQSRGGEAAMAPAVEGGMKR